MSIGTLVIKPLEAKLTHDTDFFSKMDPYCQILIGTSKVQGKVCKSGGKHPHWDDTITVHRNGEPSMFVELKDKDTFTSDDIIGVTQVDLTTIHGVSAKWYPLYFNRKPAGEVLLEIIYTPDAGVTSNTGGI